MKILREKLVHYDKRVVVDHLDAAVATMSNERAIRRMHWLEDITATRDSLSLLLDHAGKDEKLFPADYCGTMRSLQLTTLELLVVAERDRAAS